MMVPPIFEAYLHLRITGSPSHRVLSIEFDDAARQALEVDGVSIDLKLDDQQVFVLAEGLRRMFKNDRCSPVTLKLCEER